MDLKQISKKNIFEALIKKLPPIYIVFVAILIASAYLTFQEKNTGFVFFIICIVIAILATIISLWSKIEDDSEKPSDGIKISPELREEYLIGIDIGAGFLYYCLMDYAEFIKNPNDMKEYCIEHDRKETPDSLDKIYNETCEVILDLTNIIRRRKKSHLAGVGIGLPGIVEPKNGILIKAPNPGLHNIQFVDGLVEKLVEKGILQGLLKEGQEKKSIWIDNDVQCATRFEWMRSGKTKQNFVCFMIGFGLGSGIVANGKILYGRNFRAGEAGHMIISHDHDFFSKDSLVEKCTCGKKGHHWEMYTSNKGMVNMAESIDPIKCNMVKEKYSDMISEQGAFNTFVIERAYREGDEYISIIVDNFLKYLAKGIANYVNIFDPEEVILGGGMIRGFCHTDRMKQLLQEKIDQYTYLPSSANLLTFHYREDIRMSALGAALISKDESYLEFVKEGS